MAKKEVTLKRELGIFQVTVAGVGIILGAACFFNICCNCIIDWIKLC